MLLSFSDIEGVTVSFLHGKSSKTSLTFFNFVKCPEKMCFSHFQIIIQNYVTVLFEIFKCFKYPCHQTNTQTTVRFLLHASYFRRQYSSMAVQWGIHRWFIHGLVRPIDLTRSDNQLWPNAVFIVEIVFPLRTYRVSHKSQCQTFDLTAKVPRALRLARETKTSFTEKRIFIVRTIGDDWATERL